MKSKLMWQPMRLSHVGDVTSVMQKKSGPNFDTSTVTARKGF